MPDSKIEKNNHRRSVSEQSASLFVSQDDSLAALLLQHGIKVRDFVIPSFLADQVPLSTIQLARVVGVEPTRILGSLKRLSAAGLILRDPKYSATDSIEMARLTGRGQDVFRRIDRRS